MSISNTVLNVNLAALPHQDFEVFDGECVELEDIVLWFTSLCSMRRVQIIILSRRIFYLIGHRMVACWIRGRLSLWKGGWAVLFGI